MREKWDWRVLTSTIVRNISDQHSPIADLEHPFALNRSTGEMQKDNPNRGIRWLQSLGLLPGAC